MGRTGPEQQLLPDGQPSQLLQPSRAVAPMPSQVLTPLQEYQLQVQQPPLRFIRTVRFD
jgi:hypothetical protein